MAYLDSRGGDNKCRHADKRGGSPDIDLEKSECDSDCERVDACRYREDEHLCEFQLVAVVACGVALNIFFLKLSMNILPPRMRRSTKATQWS